LGVMNIISKKKGNVKGYLKEVRDAERFKGRGGNFDTR